MVTLAACGFSFGGAAGSFVAAAFMDGFGWQAVFLAGGVTPLLLFPFLLLFLPESLPRLLRDAPPYARLRQLSERMAPGWQPPPAEADAEPAASLTVLELFRHGYARPTLLLWATFFVSLILLYFMVSWLPSLLQESGLTRNAANLATSMFLFAGTLGAMLLAWLADRLRSRSACWRRFSPAPRCSPCSSASTTTSRAGCWRSSSPPASASSAGS